MVRYLDCCMHLRLILLQNTIIIDYSQRQELDKLCIIMCFNYYKSDINIFAFVTIS